MKRLTEHFNSITVKKGERFSIDLPDNGASTGYMWSLSVMEGKAHVVKHEYIDPNPPKTREEEMVCGKTICNRTTYEAEETGEIEIRADFARPWEKKAPARTHIFKVTVK